MNEAIFISVYKSVKPCTKIHTATYFAYFLGMYAGKTSSKHSEVLTEHVSYSSIDKAMACDDRVTRILNKQKMYFVLISRRGITSRFKLIPFYGLL
jgi:hypothetical protein